MCTSSVSPIAPPSNVRVLVDGLTPPPVAKLRGLEVFLTKWSRPVTP